MSLARNRSQSSHSPNVNQRALQLHLQGVQDAITAFDGYEAAGPEINSTVLERPAVRQRMSFLERLLEKGRRLVSAVAQWFQR